MADLTPLDRAVRAARRGHDEAARRLLDDVLQGEPDNELALAWRARVEPDPDAKAGLLRRVLALNSPASTAPPNSRAGRPLRPARPDRSTRSGGGPTRSTTSSARTAAGRSRSTPNAARSPSRAGIAGASST